MAWLYQLPTLVAMLAVTVLTGWTWLRVLGARLNDGRVNTTVHIAIAPLLTFGLMAVAANLARLAKVSWSANFVAVLMVIAVAGFVVDLFVRRGRRRVIQDAAPAHWDWPIIGTIFGSITLASLPLLSFADPRNPLQQWDPSFHYNGVWTMIEGADGSLFGLSPMFSVTGDARAYYPDGWHAFVALFSTKDTVVQTVNTSSLALIFWWVTGVAGFVHYLWGRRYATLTATTLAGLTLSFPADFVSMYAQWPNATSMALLPALLTLAWIVGNAWVRALFVDGQWASTIVWTALFGLAAVGALAIHPISFFNALAFVLVPAGGALLRLFKGAIKANKRGTALFLSVAMLGAVGATAVAVFNPQTLGTASFERRRMLLDALLRPFVPVPPFKLTVGFVLLILVFLALLVLGLWQAWTVNKPVKTGLGSIHPSAMKSRWIVGTWAVFALLVFLSYAPNFGLQILTGPWYSDPRRIMGAMQVVLILVFTLGAMQFSSWLRQRKAMHRALPILLIVVGSGAGAIDARAVAVQSVYDPQNLGPAGMASASQLDLFRNATQILPPDALVLGDPSVGTVYFQSMGDVKVVFPSLSIADTDQQVRNLSTSFNSIHDDPAICETLSRIGATHFYEAEDTAYYKQMRSQVRPGFYGVDTSTGFKLVKQVDGAALWEITKCK